MPDCERKLLENIKGGLSESVFKPLLSRSLKWTGPTIVPVSLRNEVKCESALLLKWVLSKEEVEAIRGRVDEMLAHAAGDGCACKHYDFSIIEDAKQMQYEMLFIQFVT